MTIETLSSTSHTIPNCIVCSAPLEIVCQRAIVGDDYGSWVEWDVYLKCGHTLEEMTKYMNESEYNDDD